MPDWLQDLLIFLLACFFTFIGLFIFDSKPIIEEEDDDF